MLICYDIEVDNTHATKEELLYETGTIEKKLKEIIKTQAIDGKEVAIIDHKELLENWFPETGCHIFMSHSHKDEAIAINIANKLYRTYGIKTFIDSKFWGYVDKAISEINHLHSKCESDPKYLDYERSMRVASNFYIVLVNALTDGIFKSDSCWFLNTDNSLNASDDSGEGTYSPWLYTEINYTSTVRQVPHPARPKIAQESAGTAMDAINGSADFIKSQSRDFSIRFSADKEHMHKVDNQRLNAIVFDKNTSINHQHINPEEPFTNLDLIYNYFNQANNQLHG